MGGLRVYVQLALHISKGKKKSLSRRCTRPPPTAVGVIQMTEQFHFHLAADVTIPPLSAQHSPSFLFVLMMLADGQINPKNGIIP